MRTALALLVALTLAAPAFATSVVEGQQVMYVGGTVAGLKEGTMGRLDLSMEKGLVFEAAGARYEIPYAQMTSHNYTRKLARRMGVVATVVVVLVKRRQRRHFIEVNYRSDDGTPQVAVFEISKDAVQTVTAVLNARAPQQRAAGLDCARYPQARPCQAQSASLVH
jgi:hypothetical protein